MLCDLRCWEVSPKFSPIDMVDETAKRVRVADRAPAPSASAEFADEPLRRNVRATRLDLLRRLTRVRDDLGKLAVWLWTTRGEKTLAHALFRWLLDEATALDDRESVVLQRRNVDCGF